MAPTTFEFEVEKVEKATEKLQTKPIKEALDWFVGDIEKFSASEGQNVLEGLHYHGLLAAVYIAYSRHYPLVLTPDAIWITICQGVAHHMVIHGERLRERFVSHQGQLKLTYQSDGKGNNTEAALREWSSQIREHVGEKVADALTCNFSTTTDVDRAVSHVTMMDAFRRYFKFEIYSICGLPSIILEGTEEDWKLLRRQVDTLEAFDMEWWLQDLRPILDHFVRARSGDIDRKHWQDICKVKDAYGGSIINGWIGKLFPYLRSFINGPCSQRNPDIGVSGNKSGFSTLYAPTGLSKVPFTVLDGATGTSQQKEIVAGFLGVEQDLDTLALRPMTGWATRKAPKMDELIHRVMDEHNITETPMESRSLFDDAEKLYEKYDRNRSRHLPEDLDRIYFEMTDVVIGGDGIESIKIVPKCDIRPLKVVSGESERTWFSFAELQDGRLVVADFQGSYRDPRPRDELWSYDRNFCFVGVYDTKNGFEHSQVVAYSIREWLEQSLDWVVMKKQVKTAGPSYYWDADGFEPFGSIANPTQ